MSKKAKFQSLVATAGESFAREVFADFGKTTLDLWMQSK